MEENKHFRKVRSFVVREGRITPLQQRGLDEGFSIYGLDVTKGTIDPKAIFGDYEKLIVEVGFGMGSSLFEMAKTNPQNAYIGIEVHRPGIGALCHHALKENIKNVRIFHHDAVEVLKQCIPDDSLDIFQLFFPDPWPKKKHHKRRILQPSFVELIASKLKIEGVFHMATDWEHYAISALEVVETSSLKNTSKDYAKRPDWRPETKFERKGLAKGHGVWDLLFYKL